MSVATTAPVGSELRSPEPPRRRRRWRSAVVLLVLAVLAGAVSAAVVVAVRDGGSGRPAPTASAGTGKSTPPKGGTPAGTPGNPVGSIAVPAGFPSASDSGVPAGTKLVPQQGTLRITKDGTTISGKLIQGCVTVAANNVTIEDSRIQCSAKHPAVVTNQRYTGTVITDTDIDGMGVATVGLLAKNTTATRINVYNSGDGVHLSDNATLQDSYVHDLSQDVKVHHDLLQTLKDSTATNIRVTRDTLIAYSPADAYNSVYHMGSGAISDVVVSDSFLDGGHYTVQVQDNKSQHDIVFRDNHFGFHYHFNIVTSLAKGNAVTLQGNVFEGTGQPATSETARGKGLAK